MVVKNREGDFCCFMCYYYTNLYLVVVVALSGAVFDVHYHSAHAKKMVCSATGVYAPKCHQDAEMQPATAVTTSRYLHPAGAVAM